MDTAAGALSTIYRVDERRTGVLTYDVRAPSAPPFAPGILLCQPCLSPLRARALSAHPRPTLLLSLPPGLKVIHGTATLGKPKVDSARDRMLDVNPHITVETYHEQLNSENALSMCDGYDVVSARTHHGSQKQARRERSRTAERVRVLKARSALRWFVDPRGPITAALPPPPAPTSGLREKVDSMLALQFCVVSAHVRAHVHVRSSHAPFPKYCIRL